MQWWTLADSFAQWKFRSRIRLSKKTRYTKWPKTELVQPETCTKRACTLQWLEIRLVSANLHSMWEDCPGKHSSTQTLKWRTIKSRRWREWDWTVLKNSKHRAELLPRPRRSSCWTTRSSGPAPRAKGGNLISLLRSNSFGSIHQKERLVSAPKRLFN